MGRHRQVHDFAPEELPHRGRNEPCAMTVVGAVTEAIADPWLERNQGFEWRGSPYTSELVADLMLQLIEMGLVKPGDMQSR
jgi:hypothetical protein